MRSGCRECRGRRLRFGEAWSAFAYEGVARQLVSALKGRGATAVGRVMAEEICERAPPELLACALAPVPAHPRRTRRHGFNHALVLARAIARLSGAPVLDVLERVGDRPQVGLEREDRLRNMRGAIGLRESYARAGLPADVAVVDDVYTTGATLDACAAALRGGGAERVLAITFSRTVRD